VFEEPPEGAKARITASQRGKSERDARVKAKDHEVRLKDHANRTKDHVSFYSFEFREK